ncbi:MAG: FG-GAP repeat domain-containing protein [Thermoplasmata archaeon]
MLPGVAALEIDESYLGSAPGRFNSVKICDLDNDGNKEIVLGNYEGYLNLIQWKGDEFRGDKHMGPYGKRLWGIHVADIDGDGAEEILAGDGDGNLRVFNGSTFDVRFKMTGMVRDVHGIAVGDVDNDGEREIVVGTGYKMDFPLSAIYVYSANTGELENQFYPGNASRMRGVAIADIDGDSFNELIFGTGVSLGETPGIGYLNIYQFDGSDYTREWQSDDLNGDVVAIEVLDVDGDGNLEIVASNGYREGPGFLFIFRYLGEDPEGRVEYEKVWESENIGPKPYGLDVADIDADGIDEIVIGNMAGYIWIFDGSTHEVEWKSPPLGSDIFGIDLGDVDGDGQIEIVAAQGGYQGKGDFTSAYTAPHIYVLDGSKHTIEVALGGRDYVGWVLEMLIAVLVIGLLVGLNVYFSRKKRNATAKGKEST